MVEESSRGQKGGGHSKELGFQMCCSRVRGSAACHSGGAVSGELKRGDSLQEQRAQGQLSESAQL